MSFRLKTILGIVAIEGLLLLTLVLGSLDILRSSNEHALAKRANTMVRAFAIMARDGVTYMETALMASALREVGSQSGVVYARIRNANGDILLERKRGDGTNPVFNRDITVEAVTDDIFDVDAPIIKNGNTVGKVEIGLSTVFIDTIVANSGWKLMLIAGLGVIVTVLFSFAFASHLTRQLESLRYFSRRISDGGIGQQVDVSGDVEIAETIRAFNYMSARLKGYYDEALYSERRIRSVFDNVALAVVIFDENGKIVEFNAPAEWIFGYAAEEAINTSILSLLADQSHTPLASILQGDLITDAEERPEYQFELEAVRKDGRHFPAELILSQYNFEGTKNYTVLVRDITNEKTLEKKTLQAESVFENMGDAVVITDAENKVVQINPAYTRITGFEPEDVVGNTRQISKTESLDHDFFATTWEALTEHGIWSGEVWDTRKNGEIFPAWMTTTELTNDAGEVTNYINTFRDITESKKVERIKSEFVSTVSHELRTPVTSIKGSLGILQSGAFGQMPEKANKMLELATNNCNRLINLINDILNMEKIESGTVAFKMAPLDLNSFIEEAIASCQHYGEDRAVQIQLASGSELSATLIADKSRLIQVMANLLSNAVKFSPDNGTVKVGLFRQNGDIRISVSDDGPGIPVEFQDQLFEKFTQGDASDGRQRGGTGLGLSIAKAIVEMHEGSISFDTEEGKGTTFFICLKEQAKRGSPEADDQKLAS